MHPKNLHKNGYPMDALCQSYPALEPFLVSTKNGSVSINFADPQAVKMLNAALLHHYYRLDYWSIPDGYLCPPVPGRADYIHGIADLAAVSWRCGGFFRRSLCLEELLWWTLASQR